MCACVIKHIHKILYTGCIVLYVGYIMYVDMII